MLTWDVFSGFRYTVLKQFLNASLGIEGSWNPTDETQKAISKKLNSTFNI